MFSLLIISALSEIISLTGENFDKIKSESNGKLLVLEFWDPWCNHCAAFKPKYQLLSETSKYRDKLIFTNTDCVENKEFCIKISHPGYPQIVLYDPERDNFIVYEGIMEIDNIEYFLYKQLNFPLIFLDNSAELNPFIQTTNISSLFVLKLNKNEIKEYIEDNSKSNFIINIIKSVASNFRNSSANFICISSENAVDKELIVYRSIKTIEKYNGDWSQNSLTSFVNSNILPTLPPLTDSIFSSYKQNYKLCLVFFIDSYDQYLELLDLTEKLDSKIKIYYMNYDKNDYFCKFIGIKEKSIPQLVILDIAREQWYFYNTKKENFSADSLSQWINGFDPSKVKWKGPGQGAFSDLISTFYTLYANGGWRFYVAISCIVFLIFAFGFMVFDIITLYSENREQKND